MELDRINSSQKSCFVGFLVAWCELGNSLFSDGWDIEHFSFC